MLSYVLFFTLALAALGLLFWQVLKRQLDSEVQALLDNDFGAIKGWVSIKNERPVWEKPNDEDEQTIVGQLKQVYFIAEPNGSAMDYSETYHSLGLDSSADIQRILRMPDGLTEYTMRSAANGVPYLIKRGWLTGPSPRQRYFLAIGRSLGDSQKNVRQLTRDYVLLLPGLIALCTLLGWLGSNLLFGRTQRPTGS
jgi:hypothetical protein